MQKRKFTKDFKLRILQELQTGKTAAQLSREHDIKEQLISKWRREFNKNPDYAFNGSGKPSKQETREAQLERKIGQLYLENEFLKKVNANLQTRFAELKKNQR